MTLDDFLSVLDISAGEIQIFYKSNVKMPKFCWIIDLHDFTCVDDYAPPELLLAKVVDIKTGPPLKVVVDL